MNKQQYSQIELAGSRCLLRPLRPEDADGDYPAWMRDPEVTRFLQFPAGSSGTEEIRAYIRASIARQDEMLFAILDRESRRHIGNIKLGMIHETHRSGNIGILVGDRGCWGRGVATEAIGLVRDFAVQRLRLTKLTSGCLAPNRAAERAFLKAGFHVEAVRRLDCLLDGAFVDKIQFAYLAPERTGAAAKDLRPGADGAGGTAVHHIGLAVRSLDQAVEFYGGVLGLPCSDRHTVGAYAMQAVFVDVGGVSLELMQPLADEGPVARHIASRGEGVQHLAIAVEDLDAWLERLEKGGAWILDQAGDIGVEGARVAFIHPVSACGLLVELVEKNRRDSGNER